MCRTGWLAVWCGLFVLTACTSDPWMHRVKGEDQFTNDYNRCENQQLQMQMSGIGMVSANSYQQQTLIERCLRKQGWVKKSDLE